MVRKLINFYHTLAQVYSRVCKYLTSEKGTYRNFWFCPNRLSYIFYLCSISVLIAIKKQIHLRWIITTICKQNSSSVFHCDHITLYVIFTLWWSNHITWAINFYHINFKVNDQRKIYGRYWPNLKLLAEFGKNVMYFGRILFFPHKRPFCQWKMINSP